MKRSMIAVLLTALAVVVLDGCSERDQTAQYTNGRYRGKPDTRPWDNVAPEGGEAWARGDQATWENRVRARQDGQNENHRIGH